MAAGPKTCLSSPVTFPRDPARSRWLCAATSACAVLLFAKLAQRDGLPVRSSWQPERHGGCHAYAWLPWTFQTDDEFGRQDLDATLVPAALGQLARRP
jgi:hypothetical protein